MSVDSVTQAEGTPEKEQPYEALGLNPMSIRKFADFWAVALRRANWPCTL